MRFSSFAWQRGTLQLIAIHLITHHNILEYLQIAIIQIEAANFVKMNICVILKTFDHDCISSYIFLSPVSHFWIKWFAKQILAQRPADGDIKSFHFLSAQNKSMQPAIHSYPGFYITKYPFRLQRHPFPP